MPVKALSPSYQLPTSCVGAATVWIAFGQTIASTSEGIFHCGRKTLSLWHYDSELIIDISLKTNEYAILMLYTITIVFCIKCQVACLEIGQTAYTHVTVQTPMKYVTSKRVTV